MIEVIVGMIAGLIVGLFVGIERGKLLQIREHRAYLEALKRDLPNIMMFRNQAD